MNLQELLTETVETPSLECWDDESTDETPDDDGTVMDYSLPLIRMLSKKPLSDLRKK